jgi:uncharacterized protein
MMFESFMQMKKVLSQINHWLDVASAHATQKSYDTKVLLGSRLAPDQFAFTRQLQVACDTAKLGASRLTGKEAPSHDDSEQTVDELKARIVSTVAYLNTLTAADFSAAPTRSITQPRWEGRTMTGADYFLEHVTPNFYFHTSHVYAILRHNGVALGKKDYLGALTQKSP